MLPKCLALLCVVVTVTACGSDATPAEPAPPAAPALPADAAQALAWIDVSATPVTRFTPDGGDADLQPVVAMAGAARVIGMGEGTHGTREFVQLRDRLTRLLVRTANVRGLAVEATLAEAVALDRYVRTGEGDVSVLQSRLYFWVTNTQEMRGALEWLRAYNAGKPADEQVGFYGIDVQYHGAAIDSVTAYARRVSPSLGAFVAAQYRCMEPYRNGVNGLARDGRYDLAPAATKAACRAAVRAVHDSVAALPAAARAAPAQHDLMLRLARVVVQYEDAYGSGSSAFGSTADGRQSRDTYLAENALWALGRLPANGRLVVWAHNGHVAVGPLRMGLRLHQALGAGYVAIATAFDRGTVTARPAPAAPPTALAVDAAPEGSYEAVFRRSRHAAFIADVRAAPAGTARAWFNGSTALRGIGALFAAPGSERDFAPSSLISEYGIIAFTRVGTATTVLPFDYGTP